MTITTYDHKEQTPLWLYVEEYPYDIRVTLCGYIKMLENSADSNTYTASEDLKD